jgi:hypothetical protein
MTLPDNTPRSTKGVIRQSTPRSPVVSSPQLRRRLTGSLGHSSSTSRRLAGVQQAISSTTPTKANSGSERTGFARLFLAPHECAEIWRRRNFPRSNRG